MVCGPFLKIIWATYMSAAYKPGVVAMVVILVIDVSQVLRLLWWREPHHVALLAS